MSTLLAPSILSADFGHLARDVARVAEAGADWIHVDVMDGHFVPNITLGPAITQAARRATDLPLDVHLMIENPDRYLEDFARAGATYLTVHQEACPHLHRTVQAIRELGVKPGVALNPATPIETLSDILPELALVLIMTVNPGFGGQTFIPGALEKARRTRSLLDRTGSGALLEVDGGVSAGNAADLRDAGVDVMVAGSSVFGHPGGAAEGLRALRAALADNGAHG
ncbi:MAG TPA: ribulose-phosphate 3-epimerase [Longimicrobiales bacterium]|nr:ribulose-phosphate 3-epimerase [Longimicrobiales bacterium]